MWNVAPKKKKEKTSSSNSQHLSKKKTECDTFSKTSRQRNGLEYGMKWRSTALRDFLDISQPPLAFRPRWLWKIMVNGKKSKIKNKKKRKQEGPAGTFFIFFFFFWRDPLWGRNESRQNHLGWTYITYERTADTFIINSIRHFHDFRFGTIFWFAPFSANVFQFSLSISISTPISAASQTFQFVCPRVITVKIIFIGQTAGRKTK